jgi:AcrR family transcriptional regulator
MLSVTSAPRSRARERPGCLYPDSRRRASRDGAFVRKVHASNNIGRGRLRVEAATDERCGCWQQRCLPNRSPALRPLYALLKMYLVSSSGMLVSMAQAATDAGTSGAPDPGRRERVLESALMTFARFGYRKASMDDVAREAGISRPAVAHGLDGDLAAAARSLAEATTPLPDRLVDAFDHWTGRYIGPLAQDVSVLIDSQPELLEAIVTAYPERFALLVQNAIAEACPTRSPSGITWTISQTLLSAALGIKHQATTREEFVARMRSSVEVLLRALPTS